MSATKFPWYKRNPTRYLMATRDLTCEERGAYNDVLELLYERNRRVPDDARYLAGFIGLSARRWKQIRQALIDAGKLRAVNGYLTNDEFENQRLQEEAETERFRTWGHEGGKKRALNEKKAREEAAKAKQQKLAFPDEIGSNPPSKGKPPLERPPADPKPTKAELKRVFDDFISISNRELSEIDEQKREISEDKEQASLKLTRARRTEEHKNITPTAESLEPREDLLGLTARVTNAAGVSVIQPSRLAREMDIVKSWVADGLDFDTTVFPTIERKLQDMKEDDTVGSLAFFDAAIRKKHSLSNGRSRPRPAEAPAALKTAKDAEDPRVPKVRENLKRRLGGKTFDGWIKPVAFSFDGESLVVTTPSKFFADWVRNHFGRDLAEASGCSEVRIVTE